MKYYSQTNNGFYDDSIHKSLPTDAVKITDEQWTALLDGQAKGQMITSDEKGNPINQDRPPAPTSLIPTPPSLQDQIDTLTAKLEALTK